MAPLDDGFNGDDFSNNLFSDLAPLLSLFGEQVTKQFLSLSTDWADNVLLAMGPLGIITVVVSAIRVGGGPWLKALVGRSREEKAVIEQELLSSTSDEICELWNGDSIVRTKGKPPKPMKTLVITDDGRVFNLNKERDVLRSRIYEFHFLGRDFWSDKPPPANLTLNLRSSKSQLQERRWLAAFGLLLQFTGLAVSGIAPKKWGWTQSGNKDEPYAYPFYLGGSLLLFCGMIACGYIIEAATKEMALICCPKYRKKVAVVRFQAACTVGDQHFPNCAIFNPFDNPDLCVSTLNMQHRRRYLAPVATAVTMAGFFIQFVGLRSLHWSAAVIQLGVTVVMTLVRAFARRGLSINPPFFKIQNRIPLETEEVWAGWLAWKFAFVAQGSAAGQVDWNAKFNKGDGNSFENFAPGQLFTTELCGIEYFNGMASTSRDLIHVNKTPATAISYAQPQAITNTEELRTWYKAIKVIKEITDFSDEGIVRLVFKKAGAVSRGIHRILMIVKPLRSRTTMWKPGSLFLPDERDGEIHWEIDVVQQLKFGPLAANRNIPTDKITLQSVAISLGLGTEPDDRRNSKYTSRKHEFHVDLAALLLLWRYSLAVAGWRYSDPSGLGIGQPEERGKFGRIVGADPPHLICKTSLLAEWMNRSLVPPLVDREWDTSQESSIFFGMYLSTLSHSVDFPQDPRTENGEPPESLPRELIIFDSDETTYTEQMARELFSLFVLAIAGEIQEVPGRTTKTEERKWANEFFDSLAEEAVKAELAKDLDDALTLVIPAFARYGLLPKQYTDEEHASSSSAAEPHVPDHSPSVRQRRSGAPNEQSGTPQDRS